MSDAEILDWIESQLQQFLGGGEFWHIEHVVHAGDMSLRQAVEAAQHRLQRT